MTVDDPALSRDLPDAVVAIAALPSDTSMCE